MEMAMASHDSITITVQDPPAPLENTADSSKEDEAGISQPSDIAQTRIPQIFEFLPKAGDHLLRTQARVIEKPYICRVPHLLREVNKRAYEPNVISIGPYHHGLDLERFKVTEALKLSCFLTIFKENNSVADKIVRSMQRLEARVRECYEEASDLDSKEFVEMMVYDGCFIVLLILGYADDDIFKAIGILREIEKDLLLLENQLPFFVLSELYRIIVPEEEGVHQLSHHVISYYRNCYLFHLFDNLLPDKEIKHLLHLVHSCHHPSASGIKQHQDFKRKAASKPTSQRKMKFIGNATELDDAGINFLGATIEKMKDQKPGIETEFDIMFTKDTKLLMIPTLNVYDGTERQFRNYIAYEQFIPCSEPIYFSDYVLFMDYLIDTSKDVQLLRKSGIIENGLGDDEAVAQMFNRLLDSVYCSSTDFYYAEIFGRMTKQNSPSAFGGVTSGVNGSDDIVAALSGMNLSSNGVIDEDNQLASQIEHDVENHQSYLFGLQDGQNHIKQQAYLKKSESGHLHMPSAKSNGSTSLLQKSAVPSTNFYMKGSPTSTLNGSVSLPAQYQHGDSANVSFQNYGLSGYPFNPTFANMMPSQLRNSNLPPLYENVAAASAMTVPGMDSRVPGGAFSSEQNISNAASESHNLGRVGSPVAGNALNAPFIDPLYLQYLRTSDFAAAQQAALNDPAMDRNFLGNSYMNLLELQKAYLGALLSPQKSQYGVPLGAKSGSSNLHGFYGNTTFGAGMSYPGSPLASAVIPNSPVGPGSPIGHTDMNMRFPSGMRNLAGGVVGLWHLDPDESFASCLLEEFKSNKTKCFELSEIAGHVVEFSADQYGSRFIQQKLETATTEEKTMVYEEIMPQALALMTDVFGNYVIQKFFEHGLPSQRRELAGKLYGHVLTLGLQMYGCRVIQKAIEVVDLDQKIKMVQELDGSVMRCVRDQNGNHVIQKCIECVPEESIQFIVTTFFDQVVTLSAHPYGCRVIQRILEHCKDPKTQSKVMDEILGSVSMLAQDQYGNYVVQHVLEHGKPHERSIIIKELAGKIVQMSQQKFASNVVEKCLTFGGPSERQLLVNEMLGCTDENEPLQAMMKDQFANYVVQKVLEICDDQQRELILSRIKVHLNALKKYTYGKHIVARVEKLVAAGERRIAAQSPHPAA